MSVLDSTKIEELKFDFDQTSQRFWNEFSRFQNLKKLEIKMDGEIPYNKVKNG